MSILSLFPFLPMFLVYSLLSHFYLWNVGCRSSYHKAPRSTNPQTVKSILSHFSWIQHLVIFVCCGRPIHTFPANARVLQLTNAQQSEWPFLLLRHVNCIAYLFILSQFSWMWMQDNLPLRLPFSLMIMSHNPQSRVFQNDSSTSASRKYPFSYT